MIYWKYLKQIFKHRYYVTIECWKMGLWFAPLFHDNSKFSPAEFTGYANYYMRKSPERAAFKKQYDYAWNGHWKKNKHHWQYWLVDINTNFMGGDGVCVEALEIPPRYLKEMLADWIAAGIAYTGKDNLYDWWEKNKDRMILHSHTRSKIHAFIRNRQLGVHAPRVLE